MIQAPPATLDLLHYIDASPSPWHAVEAARARLREAGYVEVSEADEEWPADRGAFLTREGGSLVAWRPGLRPPVESGFRIIGAHTDSPALRLKTRPDRRSQGYDTLSVEAYGGLQVATWADRDLGLCGRAVLRADGPLALRSQLFRIDRPLCRVATPAIHLNREVNREGLKLNVQTEVPALFGLGGEGDDILGSFLAEELGVDRAALLGVDAQLFDLQASTPGGRSGEFLFAPRLDNLASCHAALDALLTTKTGDATAVLLLFGHEEIGSRTSEGAAGSYARDVLTRLAGDTRRQLGRAAAASTILSTDMAHAVHPNFATKHDDNHRVRLNAGPVIKVNANWRYAGSTEAAALFRALCADHEVPVQEYVHRADEPCGSTIGAMAAANLGMRTVDVGNPMLSMHSIRELGGTLDQPWMIEAMRAFLGYAGGR